MLASVSPDALGTDGVSAGFVGWVVGAALPVAIAEIGYARRSSPVGEPWWRLRPSPRDGSVRPVDWESTMPPPRTALRPRWESSSDPADEDDIVEFLLTVAVVAVLTAGVFFGAAAVARFAVFALCGAAFSIAFVGAFAAWRRRVLPPGARHVILRGGLIATLATIALLWFSRTTFRGLSYAQVHRQTLAAPLRKRPGEVHKLFGTDGLLLYGALALGVMLALGLIITVLIDGWAMLAATRLGEGSTNSFYGWLAQLYPRRQLRLWVSATIVGVVSLLLCTGAILTWYDKAKAKGEVVPAEVPIVRNPPGTITPPPSTAAPSTSTGTGPAGSTTSVPTAFTVPVAPPGATTTTAR